MIILLNDILCYSVTSNWVGKLRLYFELCNSKTVLVENWHFGPFFVQKVFYPEDNVPHVYLLHPPGGLVEGDQLNLTVNLGFGTQVLLTTPGATKFYRSNGGYVYLKQRFNFSQDSILEWLPQSNIFFPQSKVIIDIQLKVSKGARFIFFETLCFNYLLFREALKKLMLNIFLFISLENSIGLRECIKIDHSNELIFNKFGGCQISATFFAMPCNVKILKDVRTLIDKSKITLGGATLLDGLLIIRLLDDDNELVQRVLHNLWCFLRPIVIGRKAITPRVWLT